MAVFFGANTGAVVWSLFVLGGVFIQGACGRSMNSGIKQCLAPDVIEGETGKMTFFLNRSIDFSSVGFYANLRRSDDPDWDILLCHKANTNTSILCDINSPLYRTTGIDSQHSLKILIPDITQHLSDKYVLQVYINGKPQPPDFCFIKVNLKGGDGDTTVYWPAFIAVIVVLALILIATFVYLALRRFRFTASGSECSEQLLLGGIETEAHDVDAHKVKRWFHERVSEEDEPKLLQYHKNREGSFFVKVSDTNEKNYVLAVLFKGMKYLTIVPSGNLLHIPSTGERFATLCNLVDYYKRNDIFVNGISWGRLSKPIEWEPDPEWFFGELTGDREKTLLGRIRDGTFLIMDSAPDPDAYYLSIKRGPQNLHLGIHPNDEGFKLLDTDCVFPSLGMLVEHYRLNDIIAVDSRNYGKLVSPCPRILEEKWLFHDVGEEFEEQLLTNSRNTPGAFLLRRGSTTEAQGNFVLTVHAGDGLTRFKITRTSGGFQLQDEDHPFASLSELVDHYKSNDLKDGNKSLGKLGCPFEEEIKEEWYAGQLDRREQEKAFKSRNKIPKGSFLIRHGLTFPDGYSLAVKFGDTVHVYPIERNDDGFLLRDVCTVFKTLHSMVEHYKRNDIKINDRTIGKLSQPVRMK